MDITYRFEIGHDMESNWPYGRCCGPEKLRQAESQTIPTGFEVNIRASSFVFVKAKVAPDAACA